jgi:hypothetical protein
MGEKQMKKKTEIVPKLDTGKSRYECPSIYDPFQKNQEEGSIEHHFASLFKAFELADDPCILADDPCTDDFYSYIRDIRSNAEIIWEKLNDKDQRPFLSLLAQDGLPLKLILDSGQEFDVMSNGQSHHVIIKYTIKKKRGRKLGSKNKRPKRDCAAI